MLQWKTKFNKDDSDSKLLYRLRPYVEHEGKENHISSIGSEHYTFTSFLSARSFVALFHP